MTDITVAEKSAEDADRVLRHAKEKASEAHRDAAKQHTDRALGAETDVEGKKRGT